MILSSRKIPPTIALRRIPSTQSTTTLSASRYELAAKHGFMHLLDSPLPSPALPSIVPRHGKKRPRYSVRACLRTLLRWAVRAGALALTYWLVWTMMWTAAPPTAVGYLTVDADAYQMVGENPVPAEPATMVIIDSSGRRKWTISIPSADPRPLRPSQYATICRQCEQVSNRLQESTVFGSHPVKGSNDYYRAQPNFMDVAEAEAHGLLPKAKPARSISDEEERMGREKMCEKSLTYVLESTDAGFGVSLMGLWASYGLAKREGRAFFIDDTNW